MSQYLNLAFSVSVTVPPTTLIVFDSSGRDVTDGVVGPLQHGQDLILKCEVRGGRPPPTLTWFVNDRLADGFIDRPEENVIVARLQEHAMMRRHLNNTYRCQASNTKLRDPIQRSVRLEMILDPLTTRLISKPDQLAADQEAVLTCESKGSRPQAVISWWRARGHDGVRTLFRRGRVENTTTEEVARSILTFVPQPSDDGAVIICVANNPELQSRTDDRKMTDNITLNVVYAPIVSLKLGASLNPDDIKQGDDVYFECDIQANPRNRGIWWYHNGVSVTHNVSMGVVLSTQSLVMQGVTRAHAGLYVCKAANDQGETASQPVRLRVKSRYAPVCRSAVPVVMGASLDETNAPVCRSAVPVVVGASLDETNAPVCRSAVPVVVGASLDETNAPVCRSAVPVVVGASLDETVRVHCAVDADPKDVRFTWRLTNNADTFEVSPQKTGPHNATTSELRYQPESDKDYGTLTCWGRNSVGGQSDPCVFRVIPAMRPSPVHNCTLRSAAASNGSSLQLLAPVPPSGTSSALGGGHHGLGDTPPPGSGVLDVECMAGPDGGLQQTFHLEAYESRTMRLRYNASAGEPAFRLDPGQLLPARTPTLHLVLYASNAKGRSQPLAMDGINLRTRERHIDYIGDEDSLSPPVMYILVVTAGLLLLAGLVILCMAYRRRHDGVPAPGVVKGGRNQLDIKHDQCYVVSYTLKSAADCAERKPDILETPRGNETRADMDSFGPARPDSLFGVPSSGSGSGSGSGLGLGPAGSLGSALGPGLSSLGPGGGAGLGPAVTGSSGLGPTASVSSGSFPYPAPSREHPREHTISHHRYIVENVEALQQWSLNVLGAMSSPGITSPLSGTAPGLGLLAACAPGQGPGPGAGGRLSNHVDGAVGNGTLRRTPREPLRDAPPLAPPPPPRESLTPHKDRHLADSIPGPESCV
ncbi:Kin of IRRE-like protein 2 [Frankliniella fusca]|uniref:Kin of IRRE-like protein 2 n=1 Tax=Frankliniella fusca TaxID=407009 RepID=A0AAE1HRP5_9NEOP|nr:Kin of IRRE-like protein 2 [Frankliniella fusca]